MNGLPLLVAVPALAGLATLALRTPRLRRGLLLGAAVTHAVLTLGGWRYRPAPAWHGWLAMDALSLLFLSLTSLLFLAAAFYAVGYLRSPQARVAETDEDENFLFNPVPEAVFCSCLLFFLGAMTLVILSRHFGLFWVAMEATTLASAPLIFFHRTPRSLEATWKYLLICSVGIALALLGTFFLAAAAGAGADLKLDALLRGAAQLDPRWLKAAALLLFVGYGTKMGLAPLHAWLPDAHSEAPSVVSALLSGALLNTAWLGILRIHQICCAAGLEAFSRDLLVLFGLLSLGVAAVFIIGQADYKRLLAYSSVEHMGILALGLGLGGAAVYGSLLHAAGHSLVKATLFMTAGNLLAAYRTKAVADVRGALTLVPVSGALWLAGLFAITGAPPFVTFLSEFIILQAAVQSSRWGVVVVILLLLAVIFVSMAAIFLRMTLGHAPKQPASATAPGESRWVVLPPLALAALALVLGVWLPAPLTAVLREAAALLGGG
ncbi:MAG: proton-conducting transporter membrane subunit [Kiritimatiellaeota bacterium]|nr:proton-conducting transporter membrane subunit [Kiritimatiellota bacterium]